MQAVPLGFAIGGGLGRLNPDPAAPCVGINGTWLKLLEQGDSPVSALCSLCNQFGEVGVRFKCSPAFLRFLSCVNLPRGDVFAAHAASV